MRNRWFIIITVVMSLYITACSIPCKKPDAGVWYCEKLRISVDFSEYHSNLTPDCAKLLNDDGSQTDIRCYFDQGNGVWFVSQDQQTDYFSGKFQYKGDLITVTSHSDGTQYTFVRIDEEPTKAS